MVDDGVRIDLNEVMSYSFHTYQGYHVTLEMKGSLEKGYTITTKSVEEGVEVMKKLDQYFMNKDFQK
jgi:hypothetical protein